MFKIVLAKAYLFINGLIYKKKKYICTFTQTSAKVILCVYKYKKKKKVTYIENNKKNRIVFTENAIDRLDFSSHIDFF